MPTRSIPQLPGYEIVNRLGRGAGAAISLALERFTRRKVAIKHVVRHGPRDDRFIQQAENEFEVAHQLEHPYLRRCYDLIRIRKWLKTRELFLIMEYVDGERLEEHCPAQLDEKIAIFLKVAEGLHAVHCRGYVHADIKPNNILLTSNGGLKIIDFGQSCPAGHKKDRIQGTPDYIAPEQVRLEPLDQRTDVYNFGATMYWVVTGKWFKTVMPAAPAAAKKITLDAQRGNDPPHEVDPQVPLPLSRLIMDCCETAAADRPRDMREVISRLELVQHLRERKQDLANSTGLEP